MPIFKISGMLKKSEDKSTAICKACEYPATLDNPIVSLGKSPDGRIEVFSHIHCKPYQDLEKEIKEKEARETDGIFAFASKFRYVATNALTDLPENSTVEATFPAFKPKGQPKDMTNTQVDANYVDGSPEPPKH
jgi:hypothetical protein